MIKNQWLETKKIRNETKVIGWINNVQVKKNQLLLFIIGDLQQISRDTDNNGAM